MVKSRAIYGFFLECARLPTSFFNQYRVNQAKKRLLLDNTVTEVCFQCGFERLSYFNRIFKKVTGLNPMQFKKSLRSV
jgi:AraC-like DNA-binding protein